jgi:hypothetical protein
MPTEFDYKTNFTRIFSIRGGCCGHALTIQSSYYSCPDKITRACFFNFTDTGGVLLSGPVVFYRKVIQSQLKTSSRSDAFSDLNFENQKLLWKTINDLPSSDDLHKHLLLKHLQEGVAHDRLSYEKPAIKRSVFVDTSNVKK